MFLHCDEVTNGDCDEVACRDCDVVTGFSIMMRLQVFTS